MSKFRLDNLEFKCDCGELLRIKQNGYMLNKIGSTRKEIQAILVCEMCGRLHNFAANNDVGGLISTHTFKSEHFYQLFKGTAVEKNGWMRLMRGCDFFRRKRVKTFENTHA
jgi:hypothetical protein